MNKIKMEERKGWADWFKPEGFMKSIEYFLIETGLEAVAAGALAATSAACIGKEMYTAAALNAVSSAVFGVWTYRSACKASDRYHDMECTLQRPVRYGQILENRMSSKNRWNRGFW